MLSVTSLYRLRWARASLIASSSSVHIYFAAQPELDRNLQSISCSIEGISAKRLHDGKPASRLRLAGPDMHANRQTT